MIYRLGHINATPGIPARAAFGESVQIKGVACGRQHTAALCTEGDLWTMGAGRDGALGHGGKRNERAPRRVEGIGGGSGGGASSVVVSVACGREHTLACTADGSVYSFGSDDFGALAPQLLTATQCTPKTTIICLELSPVISLKSHTRDVFAWREGDR